MELPENLVSQADVANFESPLIRIWGDATPEEFDLNAVRSTPKLKVVKDAQNGILKQDFLVLSGGGSKGAFGAGVLNGWTAAGNRPEFTIVTGVSTGSIIAPFAFLGSKYDALLKEFYTTYRTRDLIRSKGIGGILGGSSAVDSKDRKSVV